MTDIVFLVLLFVHIVTVVLWMGASVLFVSVLAPSMAKLTASSRADLFKAIAPIYQRYVGGTATVAVVDGLILYSYVSGYITPVSSNVALGSPGMLWIVTGIVFGLAAYIVGMAVVLRSNGRLLTAMSQTPTAQPGSGAQSSEMEKLQRRITVGSRIQALLLVLALVAMVVGANTF